MAPSPSVLLLGAGFATANMGVNALTVGAIRCVLHRWPDARILLLDYAVEPRVDAVEIEGRSMEVETVNMRFSKQPWLPNHVLRLLATTLIDRFRGRRSAKPSGYSGNAWLRSLGEASLALSVAGGDSFSDIYGVRRFLYVALPQLLCLAAGKRLIVMPQTIGPFRNPLVRCAAKYILRRAEAVYSRDYSGLALARELMGRNARCEPQFRPDLGLLLDAAPSAISLRDGAARHGKRPIVGLNVSGLLSDTGGSFLRDSNSHINYDRLIRRVARHVIENAGASVLLIPHVFGDAAESDVRACGSVYRDLASRLPHWIELAGSGYKESEIKHIIGGCDFFIGSRMHACIAAASQTVPCVSLAYSDKFRGVMETLGLGKFVADLRQSSESGILELIDGAFAQRANTQARLRRSMPAIRTAALTILENIP